MRKGIRNTRLYRIWLAMKNRCNNPNEPRYKDYGARGITVCEEWQKSFESFYNWAINNGYEDNLTIDRIDNDKGYCSENCRWATIMEQASNTRHCHYIEYNGEKHSISEWSRILDISRHNLNNRINRYGYSVERAFTEKVGTNQGRRKCLNVK